MEHWRPIVPWDHAAKCTGRSSLPLTCPRSLQIVQSSLSNQQRPWVKTLSTGLHKESTGPHHFSHFPFTGTRWMTSNQMSIYYYLFEQICTWVILELTADKRCRYQEKVYANEYKRATKQTISLVLKVHVPNQERISCPNPPKNGRSRTMDHSNYQRTDGYSHHEWLRLLRGRDTTSGFLRTSVGKTLCHTVENNESTPHSYGKFTTQLYHDQSSREYIYIEPQQFWEGSVQLKPSTEHARPKTKL